jgi:activator of HSP90 ATPase
MNGKKQLPGQADPLTRRKMIAGMAIAFGGLVSGSRTLGQTEVPPPKASGKSANQKRTSIHQEVDFNAAPRRIYEALLDSKQFTSFSGRPAEVDPKEGGAFSLFAGLIVGRNIELVTDHRVVQAWRPAHWDPGLYSIVRFELKSLGSATRVVFDHTGFPEGDYDSLLSGWSAHYWDPLAKFLA